MRAEFPAIPKKLEKIAKEMTRRLAERGFLTHHDIRETSKKPVPMSSRARRAIKAGAIAMCYFPSRETCSTFPDPLTAKKAKHR